jgi:hypothetical protein
MSKKVVQTSSAARAKIFKQHFTKTLEYFLRRDFLFCFDKSTMYKSS